MTSKIVQISAARRNRQPARRDYHQDMLTAAILQIRALRAEIAALKKIRALRAEIAALKKIRALRAEIAALKKMIPPPPFCDGLER